MNTDQLKRAFETHDPAAGVRADPAIQAAALIAVLATDDLADDRSPRRRAWWFVALPAMAAALVAGVVMWSGNVGPFHGGRAEALSFTQNGGYVDVRIVDPKADLERYRKEFADHHMNVDLRLWPAPPSLVGAMVYADDGSRGPTSRVQPIGGRDCGEMWCRTGLRIPVGLTGPIKIEFGRAARPGERYQLTGDPTVRGELLAGLNLRNRTVGEVRRLVAQRHGTVESYFDENPPASNVDWDFDEHKRPAGQVPDTWYVHDAFTGHQPGMVELIVAPGRSTE